MQDSAAVKRRVRKCAGRPCWRVMSWRGEGISQTDSDGASDDQGLQLKGGRNWAVGKGLLEPGHRWSWGRTDDAVWGWTGRGAGHRMAASGSEAGVAAMGAAARTPRR